MILDLPPAALPHVVALLSLLASVMVAAMPSELTSCPPGQRRLLHASDDFARAALLLLCAILVHEVAVVAHGVLGATTGRAWLALPAEACALTLYVLAGCAMLRGGAHWQRARSAMRLGQPAAATSHADWCEDSAGNIPASSASPRSSTK